MSTFVFRGWRLSAMVVLAAQSACGGGGGAGGDEAAGDSAPSLELANQPPILSGIADAGNSAYTYETRVRPTMYDPEGDALQVALTVADEAVVNAVWDAFSNEIVLEPLGPGRSEITISVSDGQTEVTDTFEFRVGEVTKTASVEAVPDGSEAIVLTNGGDRPVDFVLTHNGFRTFQSLQDMVDYVRHMPAEFAGEPFERKLWRFVRDNVYHMPYLNPSPWLMSPTVLVNSIGFGYCSSVAATYVELAQAAGYEARVWALTGHVVPEIRIGNAWQMFDPDLAIYYRRPGGGVADIADLGANPALITAPANPLFPVDGFPGYSTAVADIYASQADNAVWAGLSDLPEGLPGRVVLPAGARLTYQGRWTPAPVASGDDDGAYEASLYQQAALALAPGWTGVVQLPWMAWDVQGNGQVRIGAAVYAAESAALRTRLRNSDAPIGQLEVLSADDGVTIVFLVNPLRYEVMATNQVEITGERVWQVDVGAEPLPAQYRAGGPFPSHARKPVP